MFEGSRKEGERMREIGQKPQTPWSFIRKQNKKKATDLTGRGGAVGSGEMCISCSLETICKLSDWKLIATAVLRFISHWTINR